MPKQVPGRADAIEQRLAERIRVERTHQRFSYERLANLMTEAGFPIHGSAIYKIEQGAPRRKITVDELVGFATVFGTTASDLLGERPDDRAELAWLTIRRSIQDNLAELSDPERTLTA